MQKRTWMSWLPLACLIFLLVLFFSLRLDKYLSFSSLSEYRLWLLSISQRHFYLASLLFALIYIFSVAISIPGAVFLTLLGGFIFGIVWGSVLVILSATIGASILFLAVQSALGTWLSARGLAWVDRMRLGFQKNAFFYLLILRLVPLFPFWVVNIVPAILAVPLTTFISATFLGIIPGSVVYVSLGNGLSQLFAANQVPNLNVLFEPKLLFPLVALAALALIPVFYKKRKNITASQTDKELIACDVAIIGGGSAGLSIAAGAAQLGLRTILLEPAKMGGDCLNYGCIPSKSLLAAAKIFYQSKHSTAFGIEAKSLKLDFSRVMQHVHRVIANIAPHDSIERFSTLGVQVIQETGHFISPSQFQLNKKIIAAKYFVIASGSSPAIAPIEGLSQVPYLTNESIFNLKILPEHLIVIGGGPIGCELAQAFAMLGSKVCILEAFTILPKDDKDCVEVIRKQLQAMNVIIYEQIKIQRISKDESDSIVVHIEQNGTLLPLNASHLLISTGRVPNVQGLGLEQAKVEYSAKMIKTNARLQTSNKKIYAIGDVAGPYQFTHMANYQAGLVLKNIAFKIPAKVNYAAVPWVTYTEPELAHVGLLTEAALKDPRLKLIEFAFLEVDRAQAENKLEGKIKVITDKKAKILGVSIVGSQAGELILPWVMAIREGKTLRAFTDVIVPYPTLSEISKRVAGEYYKPLLFSSKVRKMVNWLNKLG